MGRFRRAWISLSEQISLRGLLVAFALTMPLVVAGAVGFVAGSPPSVDVSNVRADAADDGRAAGLEAGAEEGFEQAYQAARSQSYAPQYAAAYRKAYRREFERAGLTPPPTIRVPRKQ